MKDGKIIICHSSSQEIYAIYDKDGNRVEPTVIINGKERELNPTKTRLIDIVTDPLQEKIIADINENLPVDKQVKTLAEVKTISEKSSKLCRISFSKYYST